MNGTMTAPASAPCTVVRDGSADSYWLVQELMEPQLAAGSIDVVHVVAAPNGGPPPHRHTREDELFYVLEGDYEFTFKDTKFSAGAGTAVFLPRNVVHTYNNVGRDNGRLLVTTVPSGFVHFITTTGDICLDRSRSPVVGPATFEKLAAGCARAGIELLPTHVAEKRAALKNPARDLWVMGVHVRLLLTSKETNGQFTVAEITAQPGDFVPPHRHTREDEIFYVLEGEFEFDLREGIVSAAAGTFVHVPKGVLHGFRNCGTTPGKLLDMHTPGGFEEFVLDAGTPCTDVEAGPPKVKLEMERIVGMFTKHGMEL